MPSAIIGNAGGAALGGLAIQLTHLQLVPLFAAAVTFIGLIITIISYQSDRQKGPESGPFLFHHGHFWLFYLFHTFLNGMRKRVP